MSVCPLCESFDLIKARAKSTGELIVVCQECLSVYEVDDKGKAIFDHDPLDVEYFAKLNDLFGGFDDLIDISPYNTN